MPSFYQIFLQCYPITSCLIIDLKCIANDNPLENQMTALTSLSKNHCPLPTRSPGGRSLEALLSAAPPNWHHDTNLQDQSSLGWQAPLARRTEIVALMSFAICL